MNTSEIKNFGGQLLLRAALAATLYAAVPIASAQERIANYDNSVRLEYQYIHTGLLDVSTGPVDIGETDTHVLLLSGVYSLNRRWKIYGSIPYVQKRHAGNPFGVHDPVLDFDQYMPPDSRFIDDGDYHGGFQDFHAGVQYLAVDGPFFFALAVYLVRRPGLGLPVLRECCNWQAAPGNARRRIHGIHALFFGLVLPGRHCLPHLGKSPGVDLDYWLAYLSASYYVTPRFAPRVFLTSRNAPSALKWPEDFPDYDTENGYRHDQTFKHNYVNAGIGFDFIVSDRYEISATYYQTIDSEYVAEVDYAFTFALAYRF